MANNRPVLDKFDLTSVESIFSGAAPLGAETALVIQKRYPKWIIRQGYGNILSLLWHCVVKGR